MSQKNANFKKLEIPSKKREEFPVVGAARLFKRKDAAAADAKGFTIRPLTPEGKVDYTADAYLIWFSALDALKTGGVNEVSVFLVKYQPKPEGV